MERPSDWNAADEQRLRVLWAEGHSTAVIGKLMGRTKSSVVGKAHRLRLPSRPSPIQHGGAPRPAREKRPRVTLPALPAAAPLAPAVADAPPAPPPPPVAVTGGPGCRFPLWGLKDRATHVYCGKPALRRPDGTATSWCAACSQKVFLRRAVAA